MPIQLINAPGLPVPAGHYSHATRTGNLVCVSGQLPMRPDGTHTGDLPFEEQARQALDNVSTVLAAAGAGLKDVIEVTVYLVGDKLIAARSNEFGYANYEIEEVKS